MKWNLAKKWTQASGLEPKWLRMAMMMIAMGFIADMSSCSKTNHLIKLAPIAFDRC